MNKCGRRQRYFIEYLDGNIESILAHQFSHSENAIMFHSSINGNWTLQLVVNTTEVRRIKNLSRKG